MVVVMSLLRGGTGALLMTRLTPRASGIGLGNYNKSFLVVGPLSSPLRKPDLVRLISTGTPLLGGHGPRLFTITPSQYTWTKYKDMFGFYLMLGVIPLLIIVFCANVFVGPATLSEIPENYVPKHWEYYRNPITRWFSRYVFVSPQEDYERNLFYVCEEDEKSKMRAMEQKVFLMMAELGDYPNYTVRPHIYSKYLRWMEEENKITERTWGTTFSDTGVPK